MGVGLLYSNALVEEQAALTQEAAAGVSGIIYQAVVNLPEGGNRGIESYLRRLARRLGELSFEYEEIRDVSPEEAAERMRAVQGRPGATIIMTPNENLGLLLPFGKGLSM